MDFQASEHQRLTEQGVPLDRVIAETSFLPVLTRVEVNMASVDQDDLEAERLEFRRRSLQGAIVAALVLAASQGLAVVEARSSVEAAMAEVFDGDGSFRTLAKAYGIVYVEPTSF